MGVVTDAAESKVAIQAEDDEDVDAEELVDVLHKVVQLAHEGTEQLQNNKSREESMLELVTQAL